MDNKILKFNDIIIYNIFNFIKRDKIDKEYIKYKYISFIYGDSNVT